MLQEEIVSSISYKKQANISAKTDNKQMKSITSNVLLSCTFSSALVRDLTGIKN